MATCFFLKMENTDIKTTITPEKLGLGYINISQEFILAE